MFIVLQARLSSQDYVAAMSHSDSQGFSIPAVSSIGRSEGLDAQHCHGLACAILHPHCDHISILW